MISAVENANRFSVYAGMRTSYRSNFQSISTSTTDVKLHPNGSYIITVNTSSEKLRRRKLNTPWDLSTITGAATAGSNALVGPVGNPQGFDISPDGSNVYAVGTTQANSNTIWQFTMNSWNVQTMAGPTAEYTIDALNKLGFSIRVRPEGNTIYILGRQSGILQYNMANNWNINTASFVTSYNSYTHSTSMTGMTFDPYGTRMYLSSSGDLHQFALSSPWNVNTAVWQANTRVTSFQASVEGIDIHPDGDIVYITSGTYQFQLPLDTKWAINSARFDITTGNVSLGRIVS